MIKVLIFMRMLPFLLFALGSIIGIIDAAHNSNWTNIAISVSYLLGSLMLIFRSYEDAKKIYNVHN